jgi:hypothetical protein
MLACPPTEGAVPLCSPISPLTNGATPLANYVAMLNGAAPLTNFPKVATPFTNTSQALRCNNKYMKVTKIQAYLKTYVVVICLKVLA